MGFPGPTQVLNPNGISIGSGIFAGLTSVTDRQTATDRTTEHATWSVTIGCRYVVLRCGIIIMLTSITTSCQSNLTKKAISPPYMDGSVVFTRCHQCAANLIHDSWDPPEFTTQTHFDWFSHFCAAHRRVMQHARACPFP